MKYWERSTVKVFAQIHKMQTLDAQRINLLVCLQEYLNVSNISRAASKASIKSAVFVTKCVKHTYHMLVISTLAQGNLWQPQRVCFQDQLLSMLDYENNFQMSMLPFFSVA